MLRKFNAVLDDISLWKKGIGVVAIPLLILVITLVLMAWYQRVSRLAQGRVNHSLFVKASIYEVMALMTDSETAVRGYLLWKDPAYLHPYNRARSQLSDRLQYLSTLVQSNAEQSSNTQELRRQAFVQLDSLRDMLNNPALAADPGSNITARSRETMLAIRSIIEDMERTEEGELDKRIRQYSKVLSQLNYLMISLFLLAILTGLTASYVVFSSILSRVNDLEHYARRVSRNQTAHWEDSGDDELGQLGRNLRIMTDNLLAREEALRITRRQLELANNSLLEQLQETRIANQELEAFSYSVSHDLRAPLRHVAGFSELMLKNADTLDAKNLRYLNIISSSIKQMGILIDELLAFSRMGRTAIKTDSVDLNNTINEVFADFSPDIAQRSITWKIADLPIVTGDKVMLKLVLQNLIGNAVKYTRDKNPAIIEIYDESAPEENLARITVKDNGVGFNMEYSDKLFGVFQRLHSSEEYEGTGIGLATVRRIVQRHGGNVYADAEVEKGARFSFTILKSEKDKVEM